MPDIVVMFFLLGLVAGAFRSDLAIPKAAYDVLSLLLMLTIGLKGGMALHGNFHLELILELVGVLALGFVLPFVLFPVLRYLVGLNVANAASFCCHYGSVSAGTFAVAVSWVEARGLVTGGEVTLYLVLLELPAILLGLFFYQKLSEKGAQKQEGPPLWQETLTNRSVVLLVGGVIIGVLYGTGKGEQVTEPLTGAFSLVLSLFLLEMGLVAAETLRRFRLAYWKIVVFALVAPPLLALPGLLAGTWMGLAPGNVVILATLTASASYIAAPVAVRHAIPDADIGLAMLASLGVTFPFNVLVGISFYGYLASLFAG
ncbi:hypothetical protein SAMN05216203_0289 [Marinobacter daqiaonensis]|uniref:Sodium-dependent bicarbonate transport family permease n=1 Tax=Marinobacter daqiaonensis TaxID=650891 RepID=A0A1I6GN50_9GAMM|nr:sodium-dependent bicarbonate transport family permease [Marinobacter daqiaonensis]SFR43551.1 hypothetical protein SAMN05216203_0289 [Marinobacter daqiaonensis]